MPTEKFFNTKSDAQNASPEIQRTNYQEAAKTLSVVIKQISDLSIPEKTIQNWKILSAAIYVVDNKLDHIIEAKERSEFTRKIVDSLKEDTADFPYDKELQKAITSVNNLSADLIDSQKELFQNLLSTILDVTEKIKVEENPQKLVDLRRLEGQITAKVFLPFLPEDFKSSEEYPELIHALTRLGRTANSFDSFTDLPTDYKNKQVKIKPNVLNRLLFLGAALSDGLSLLKDTGLSVDLIKEFFLHTKKRFGK